MAGLLKRKLQGEVEIREAAGDVFHDFFANKPHQIHNTVSNEFIHGCDLHEGDYGVPGSTIEWTYTVEGKKNTIKQIVEVVDEQNKVIKFKCIGGDAMNNYNNGIGTFQVIPVTEGTSKVVITFEYEKKQPGLPEPSAEMDALINFAKQIDDHHHATKK